TNARRNFAMSFIAVGSFLALMFGSAFSAVLITTLGDARMDAWAWRIPCLVAAPLGYIAFYIRRRMEETPHFEALRERNSVRRNPLRSVVTSKPTLAAVVLTIFLPALNGPGYYLLFAYMPTYLETSLGEGHNFSMLQALLVTVCSLVAIVISIPLMATLSDRIGRKKVLAFSAVATGAAAYPMFALVTTGEFGLAAVATVVL